MSAALAVGNNTYEQTIGLMAAITEVTRNASRAARGLVSVQSRLNQIVDESSSTGQALTAWYNEHNIAIYDQEGQLRGLYDILEDVSEIWPTLTTNEKDYYLNQQAGANQTTNLSAALTNFQTALDATATAYNSAGSAAEENQKVVDSLQGKLASVRASFEQLANTVVDSGLISGVLDLANAFLQLLDTPVGAFITQVTLMTGFLGGLSSVLKYFMPVAVQFKNALFALQAVFGGAATGAEALGFALHSSLFPIITAGVAIVWGLVKVFDALTISEKEQAEKVNNLRSELSSLRSEYEQLLTKEDKTDEEEKYLGLLAKEIEAKKQLLAIESQREYEKKWGTSTQVIHRQGYTKTVTVDNSAEIKRTVEAYKQLNPLQAKTAEEYRDIVEKQAEYTTSLTQVAKELEANKEAQGELWDSTGNGQIVLDSIYEVLGLVNNKVAEATSNVKQYTIAQKNLVDIISEVSTGYNVLKEAQDETDSSGVLSSANLEKLLKQYPDLEKYLVKTSNGYALAKGALEAYTESQRVLYVNQLENAKSAAQSIIDTESGKAKAFIDTTQAIEVQIKALSEFYHMQANSALALVEGFEGEGISNRFTVQQEQIANRYLALAEQADKASQSITNAQENLSSFDLVIGGLGSGGSTTSASAKTLTDKALTAFQTYYKDLQHLRSLDEITEEEYYKQLQTLVNNYTSDAIKNMKAYGTDRKIIAQNMYQYEEELAKHTADVVKAQEAEKEKAVGKAIEAHKKELELQKSAYESLFDIVTNNIQNEIDALEKEKESKSEYYQKQIDTLNETNDALEEQIALEEALDALAKAKSTKVMVYKDGRYQYVSDIDAVSEAQASLDKIEREQVLKQEVDNLEQLKKKATASIDEQIDEWEKYKAQWSSVVSSYSNKQNMLLVEQQLGIKLEGDNWRERIDNLDAYVSEYNKTLGKIDTISGISNDGASYTDTVIAEMKKNTSAWHSASAIGKQDLSAKNLELGSLLGWSRNEATGVWYTAEGKRAYAQGTTSAQGGMSLVGEQGPEMRVLGKGDGILPTDITKNLWSWGMTTPSSMLSALSGASSSVSNAMQISIGNISLPSVSNASQFVEELKGFKRYAIQYGTGI